MGYEDIQIDPNKYIDWIKDFFLKVIRFFFRVIRDMPWYVKVIIAVLIISITICILLWLRKNKEAYLRVAH